MLLSQVFGIPIKQLNFFFIGIIKLINLIRVASIPQDQRPKVLYADMSTLQALYFTSEWCIDKAGGIAIAASDRIENSYYFNKEQLLVWDPDIILCRNLTDITLMNTTAEFSNLKAVKIQPLYVIPYCIGSYGGSNPEMILTVEWMATKFHPDIFTVDELRNDIGSFYKELVGYEMSESEVDEILAGTAGG
jgi:iron complex transport system substrate-binding protein